MENLDDDNEDILGLDDDIDDDKIYIEIKGIIYNFNKNWLKNIGLIQTIIESDKNSGTINNPIQLMYIDTETIVYLKEYIDFHKDNDYKAKTQKDLEYSDKMVMWDRLYVDKLQEKKVFNKMLTITNYLMYDTLLSKLLCLLGHSETYNDYRELFDNLRREEELVYSGDNKQ